jgi:hypothetical protein
MNNVSGTTWEGSLPAQPAGSTVYYYIEASSVSGKTQVRPMPAPAGYWKFRVLLNTGIPTTGTPALKSIYPNPSKGITCIPVVTPENCFIRLSVKNILGEVVSTIFEGINHGEKNYFINTSDFPTGIYFAELKTGNGVLLEKIIVR